MKIGVALLVLGIAALNVDAQLFQPFKFKPFSTTARPTIKPFKFNTYNQYNPGRYEPGRYNPSRYDPSRYDSSRYDPSRYYYSNSDGRYSNGGDNSGKYQGSDDGRYRPDNSGQYIHQDVGYKHIEGAQGPGGPGSPGADKYKHQEDRYKDRNDRYGDGNYDGKYTDKDYNSKYTDKDYNGKYSDKGDNNKYNDKAYNNNDNNNKDASGKYAGVGGVGNYNSDGNDGKYVHVDDKYKHVTGQDGANGPGAEKYKHVKGPEGPAGPGPEKYKPEKINYEKYIPIIDGKRPTGKAILHKCKELDKEGYSYLYDTKQLTINGAEDGALQYRGTDKEAMCAVGYYNYLGDDNKELTTYYIADELGYRPVGDHLHPQIARLLKHLEETHE